MTMERKLVAAGGRPVMVAVGVLLAGCSGEERPGPEPVDPAETRTHEERFSPGSQGAEYETQPGSVQMQPDAPPPVSGGTLLVLRDGVTAVASDPDRDRIHVVELGGLAVPWLRASIPVQRGDEPGRIAEDGAGRVHIVLRGGGALLTIDPGTGEAIDRRRVCPAPRGVAWDPGSDSMVVACAGGELVWLPAAGGPSARNLRMERDLRDVLVDDSGHLVVTRFRSSEALWLDAQGKVVQRMAPPTYTNLNVRAGSLFTPAVAWRAIALPGGGVGIIHQRAVLSSVAPGPSGYGGGGGSNSCNSAIVHGAITPLYPGVAPRDTPALTWAVLPVDVAIAGDHERLAFVAAGNSGTAVGEVSASVYFRSEGCNAVLRTFDAHGQPVAVAYDGAGRIVVQTRQPATLWIEGAPPQVLWLDRSDRRDSGHDLFHANPGSNIACASCHPEGGDDGRTWFISRFGSRRTPSVRIGLGGTEPFHWQGDMRGLPELVRDVFEKRMGAAPTTDDRIDALGHWMFALAPVAASAAGGAEAVERGRLLFQDAQVGCAGCHAGPKLTNNATVNVGTGDSFQVPSLLGVAHRAPFLHDGRAATLADRFGESGGGDRHGHTSQLSSAQIADLVAYLESL